MANPKGSSVTAEPKSIDLDWSLAAILIIDMQRDFMEPGGFGETLGNDVSQLDRAVKPIAAVLAAARDPGILVVNLLVCGANKEVCINTTVREANDRAYRCVVLSAGCPSYFPEFHEMGLKMITAQVAFSVGSQTPPRFSKQWHRICRTNRQWGHHNEHDSEGRL